MAENKMEQVAALFHKKLDEEFFVELKDDYSAKCFQGRIWRVKLTTVGLKYFVQNDDCWFINRPILSDLLTGGAVIVSEQ